MSDEDELQRMEELYARFKEQEKLQDAPKHTIAIRAKRFLHFIQSTGEFPEATADDCEKLIRVHTMLGKANRTGRQINRGLKKMTEDMRHHSRYLAYTTFSLGYRGSPHAEDFAFQFYMQTEGKEPDFTLEQAQEAITYARAIRERSEHGHRQDDTERGA